MKLLLTTLLTISLGFTSTWNSIHSEEASNTKLEVVSSTIERTEINFEIEGFHLVPVNTPQGSMMKVQLEDGASLLEAGAPDLQKFSRSIIIPDNKQMALKVISAEYVDYENIHIAPSKGNLTRSVNPAEIPFEFGSVYEQNTFFPGDIAQLGDPYILRDLRGVTVEFTPFQYNPVQQKLRVYSAITVEVYSNGVGQVNVLNKTRAGIQKYASEFKSIYEGHFLNFNNDTRFDYLVDHGNFLIISYGSFMSQMQPLVDWKNRKGIPTEMVDVSAIGSNATSIKNYVTDYYNTHGLTFLLLVGDAAQVPSTYISGSASDPNYGFLSGGDSYAEVIVGRFSAESPSHVTTQVERSINYERYPHAGADWYASTLGVASNQGPGFGGYTDDDFQEYVLQPLLLDFTYDSYQGIYDPSGSVSQGTSAINNGVGFINYTGHGYQQGWGNGAALGNSNVDALTNNNKLPFVITVGCNVGEFDDYLSFGEVWQRATNGGEPTGGIAHYGSTISQSWEPPMHGQYGMNLILTESLDENLTRTIGGIATNGCMYMNDAQGSSGINETKYWTLFGDPTVPMRSAAPSDVSASHEDVIILGSAEFSVSTGTEGDLVALSRNGELLVSAYTNSFGTAVLELGDAATVPGELDLVVTGFNYFPYETTVMVLSPEGAYVLVNDVEVSSGTDDMIEYGETVNLSLNLENVGNDGASNVSVNLSTDDMYISITNGNASTSYIGASGTANVSGLSFTVSPNVPNGHSFDLACAISSGGDTWESELSLTAYAPDIELNSLVGDLNPGESTALAVNLDNNGGAVINYPIVSLESNDAYVTISNVGFSNAYYWDNTMTETLSATVSISSACPIGHLAEFSVEITGLNAEGYASNVSFSIPVGQVTAGFENGLNGLDWQLSGDSDWDADGSEASSGNSSAKSGAIADNQESTLSVTLDVTADGVIEFEYKVSAEYSTSGSYFYDGLEFYIDNTLQGQFQSTTSGESPWTHVSFPVSAGERTFRWSYVKDGGGGSTDCTNTDCADAAWIDDVIFPPAYVEGGGGGMMGDLNGDEVLNVLDIIIMVNVILGVEPFNPAADLNGDGIVNILDVVQEVNLILGPRVDNASHIKIFDTGDAVNYTADGYVGAVKLTLKHADEANLYLTTQALVAEQFSTDYETTILIVAPESGQLFTYDGDIEISHVEAANSEQFIDIVIPQETSLHAAYPNPFNPTTTVSFVLSENGVVDLSVYSITGRLVETLASGSMVAGNYEQTWNASLHPSGMYFLRLQTDDKSYSQKLMVIK
ncbi:MAG: C25 family cysteine peptidase [Candidatus Marinimicrobia bacterium]|nr:C25 family cysteine peptidase [Candidatus Neomarinimicrobiota bacterium]